MLSWRRIVVATGVAVVAWSGVAPAQGDSSGTGRLVIVQAVPSSSFDVTVDGRSVQDAAHVGDVLGPLRTRVGRHQVGFTDPTDHVRITSTVEVAPGSSTDMVVHLPASVGGAPVVNSYRTPQAAIPPGKARVLVAHTATVAPADVRVDGTVVFHDIANGEYATADVAAGGHTVALLPTGLTTHPILGPLHVDLAAGTVTMVYAVGNPRDRSMNVISHTDRLASNGAVVPANIDTGTANLAAGIEVRTFHVSPDHLSPSASAHPGHGWQTGLGLGGVVMLAVALSVCLRRRSTRSA